MKKGNQRYCASTERKFVILCAVVFSLATSFTGKAGVQWAGTNWVDLDAQNYDDAGVWINKGTLCANFITGSGTLNNPVKEIVEGVTGVTFDGGTDGEDKNQSVDRLESTVPAPADIKGTSDWSLEVWAYNPAVAQEECMVQWAPRNSGTGATAQFNYGWGGAGAATHWAVDMAYDYFPPSGQWHHIALTYDGTTERVYIDGILNNQKTQALNIGGPLNVVIGAAWQGGYGDSLAFSGSLSVIRVHGGLLTTEQIRSNYLFEAERFGRSGAAVNWAGKAWVDLDARRFDGMGIWTNQGILCSTFSTNWGVLNNPLKETVKGVTAVTFDGGTDDADKNQSADRFESSAIAPADIRGTNSWSVEVWACNPVAAAEECMVQWAPRKVGTAAGAQFNYGNSAIFGAATHIGADIGYTPLPTAGVWHHLVLTYDGTTERVYVDGLLNNEQPRALNIGGPLAVIIGAGWADAFVDYLAFDGSLSVVRIHGDVLTAEQVSANYRLEAKRFGRYAGTLVRFF